MKLVVDLVYHFLVFDKEIRTHRTKDDLGNLKEETIRLIDEIEKAKTKNDFPPKVSPLCGWCEYRHICPEQKHIYFVENLPTHQYLKDDGVQLVNQYVKLKNQEKDLKLEMEDLREAVFEFALKENLKAIKGSDHKLRVKMENKETLPNKGSDLREQLEGQLKSLGKWMDVSRLDTNALLKKLRMDEWEGELKEQLEQFISLKESRQIYLSKLKDEE